MTNTLKYTPDDLILINRVEEADRVSRKAAKTWEEFLKDPSKLDFFEGYTEVEEQCARSYGRAAREDFRTIRNGEAMRTSFETWFLYPEFVKEIDKKTIEVLLKELSEDVPQSLSTLNKINRITQVGEFEFGNYLSSFLEILMNNFLFIEVRDRSVANFLWFAKFERSFNKAEKEVAKNNRCDILKFEPKEVPFVENPEGVVIDLDYRIIARWWQGI